MQYYIDDDHKAQFHQPRFYNFTKMIVIWIEYYLKILHKY